MITTSGHTLDDLDGALLDDLRPGETLRFGLDGITYEIDLSIAHATELRQKLEHYMDAGREVRAVSSPLSGRRAASAKDQARERADARSWLREHGHPVSDRGRIAQELLRLYHDQRPRGTERRRARA
ncbi:Lsr2 family protein [Clavibacter sp. VKM Ac-2873]|uniref:histone-like nucleoid-structuring protein Lsr2 n=1 Tax=Clavibacter sp. VKM Ac-2873 TaxID=2783813 RepID=UPI00188AFEE7|nr:Lsr2 family protein [Clavibacter sp. VKM Ac-2873]MBF4619454.1 Lsr2 family protein [Clavibacter sp. VKM Ac-2873]